MVHDRQASSACRRSRLWRGLISLITLVSSLLVVDGAIADQVSVNVATPLPVPTDRASSVWTGSSTYVFGAGTNHDRIFRIDPSNNRATLLDVTLPSARFNAPAFWDGTYAYIVGGEGSSGFLNDVLRFNPVNQTLTTMGARMPGGRGNMAMAWTGTYAYLIGGYAGGYQTAILRFDPAADAFTTMSASLADGRAAMSAIWDGSNMYAFGGYGTVGLDSNQILRFNPASGTLTTLSTTLPTKRYGTSAIWDGSNAYVIGGACISSCSARNEVLRFTPALGTISVVSNTPRPLTYTTTVWDGTSAMNIGSTADQTVMLEWTPSVNQYIDFRIPPRTGLGGGAVGETQYLFGGKGCPSCAPTDEIWRMDPITHQADLVGRLPSARSGSAVVSDSVDDLYVFGGASPGLTDQILRFRSSTGSLSIVGTLPEPLTEVAAVWTGSVAYLFGGRTETGRTNKIWRFDPTNGLVTSMGATLPSSISGASAVWDGQRARIFGGTNGSIHSAGITSYDPSSDQVSVASQSLPSGRWGTAAIWDQGMAYVVGGTSSLGLVNEIVRFDPGSGQVTVMSARLPSGRTNSYGFIEGGKVGIVGGSDSARAFGEIVFHIGTPGSPVAVAAATGPGAGQIRLTWQLPPSNTFTKPISEFRVWGSAYGSNSSFTPIAVVPGTQTNYVDSGLPNDTVRFYAVTAVNSLGEGPLSLVASAKTPGVPGQPRDLVAFPGPSYRDITISWNQPSTCSQAVFYPTYPSVTSTVKEATCISNRDVIDGGLPILGYKVFLSRDDGSWILVGQTTANTRTFTDNNCYVGMICRYSVTAFNQAGEGLRSKEVTAAGWFY